MGFRPNTLEEDEKRKRALEVVRVREERKARGEKKENSM